MDFDVPVGTQGDTYDRYLVLRITYPGSGAPHQDFTYDAYGNKLTMANELGKTWTYAYDEYSRLTSETDPLGRITQYSYGIGVAGCGSCHVDPYATGITTYSGKQTAIVYDTEWQKLNAEHAAVQF